MESLLTLREVSTKQLKRREKIERVSVVFTFQNCDRGSGSVICVCDQRIYPLVLRIRGKRSGFCGELSGRLGGFLPLNGNDRPEAKYLRLGSGSHSIPKCGL